jgi:acyl carrier protein
LAALPLTPTGKIDRKDLPAPDPRSQVTPDYVAPRTTLEATLAAIWTEVLGIKLVSVDDDFFELGGNSLSAVQVIVRVRDALRMEVPLDRLFAFPTITAFSVAILREQVGRANSEVVENLLQELEQP